MFNAIFNNFSVISWRSVHLLVSPGFLTPVVEATDSFSTMTVSPMPLVIVTFVKRQMSERMLAELWLELTTPGLTACVATESATLARLLVN